MIEGGSYCCLSFSSKQQGHCEPGLSRSMELLKVFHRVRDGFATVLGVDGIDWLQEIEAYLLD